jgi:hypothetical protein
VLVRLEEHVQRLAAARAARGLERHAHLGRMVRVVVDDVDAADRAPRLEAALEPCVAADRRCAGVARLRPVRCRDRSGEPDGERQCERARSRR